jgi:DNA-binding response OmpR family regulator
MKKIVIADNVRSIIAREESFLDRGNIKIFTSASNEETLNIHRSEKSDLIITHLKSPEMGGEKLSSIIRDEKELCKVSIIMLIRRSEFNKEVKSDCRANAFLPIPVDTTLLLDKAHELLNISKRESYRALISAKVWGRFKDEPFFCFSENISTSGMLFFTDKLLSEGDHLLCSFFLPNSRHISTDAEVVRAVKKQMEFDTNHYGINFVNLSPDDRYFIDSFVKEKREEV